jgi:quercetin dioxygenase-like cupin family protein
LSKKKEMDRRDFTKFAALSPLFAGVFEGRGETSKKPTLLPPANARVYNIGHGEAQILVDGEQSGGAWWLARLRSDPMRKTSLHVHFSADEYVYVLDGVLSAWVEGGWHELPAGGVATVPRGSEHALGNRSQQSMTYLASGNPAGFERFFADIESLARQYPYGSSEFLTELARVYGKYDSKMIGPPPIG